MSIKEFIEAIPQGIKKIATAIAIALITIFILNIAASSASIILFSLKCLVGASALIYSIGIIKENWESIWSEIGSKSASGAPVVSQQVSDSTNEFAYSQQISMIFTKIYDNLPTNPFLGLLSEDNAPVVQSTNSSVKPI